MLLTYFIIFHIIKKNLKTNERDVTDSLINREFINW